MSIIYAKRYIGELMTGACKPHIIEATDNKKYVVKFTSNAFGPRILANEWISYRLAKLLELPIPDAAKIYFPQYFIENEPTLSKIGLKEGVHFGSYYIENSIDFTGRSIIEQVSNKQDIAGIIAFDFWISNDDRSDNNGNLIVCTSGQESIVMIIDHGNAFTGPHWTVDDLCNDVEILPIDGCVYSYLMPHINMQIPFWYNKIENLRMEQIRDCVYEVPDEWQVSNGEKVELCRVLFARRLDLRNAINYATRNVTYIGR